MATYYVATYGDDNNAGTSPSAPFRTINKAAQVMANGDVTYVAPGVYREAVTVPSPASGTKTVSFIGDPEARMFPSVQPGEVRLDGSDDAVTPVRTVGVLVSQNAAIRWSRINIARFQSSGIEIRSGNVGPNFVESCRIANVGAGILMSTNASSMVEVRNVEFNPCDIGINISVGHCRAVVSDCFFYGNIGVYVSYSGSNNPSHVSMERIIFRANASGNSRRMVHLVFNGSSLRVRDAVAIGCIDAIRLDGFRQFAEISGLSAVKCSYGLFSSLDSNLASVRDSVFAECSSAGIYFSGSSNTYASVITVTKCAFPDTPTPVNQGTYPPVYSEVLRINTITDANNNVILPDFTPVGAQLLRSEEQNPIEGLRSARIDVPRIAYYRFLVAVSGANTIALKAKKSHATGTTVKFRVDEDPSKVVTLADTTDVQAVQLGPVEDRGPRFVPLEVWAQQVDYIDGHYVLIDSIQVI